MSFFDFPKGVDFMNFLEDIDEEEEKANEEILKVIELCLSMSTPDNSNIYVPESFIPKGARDRDRNRLTSTTPKQEFKTIIER